MIWVNMEALWQVLRMSDVGGMLLNGIKSMYIYSLAYVSGENGMGRTGVRF